jgi:hypothetical protein
MFIMLHYFAPAGLDGWEEVCARTHDTLEAKGCPFYTDPQAVSLFQQYVRHVLEHVNPSTNLPLKHDPVRNIYRNISNTINCSHVKVCRSHILCFVRSKEIMMSFVLFFQCETIVLLVKYIFNV